MNSFVIRFNRWRQSVPLTLLALLITGAAGILFWFVQDDIYSKRLQEIIHSHLLEALKDEAHHDWKQMDEQFRSQDRAAQLLLDRTEFINYIDNQEVEGWSEAKDVVLIHHKDQPRWLPARSMMRGFVYADHVVLADAKGRVRESYGVQGKPLPESLLEGLSKSCATENTLSSIHLWQGVPYFLTRLALRDADGHLRAILVFSVSLDDDFLLSFQFARQSKGVLVFLNDEGTQVSASSRPDLITDGTSVEVLERDYLLFGKEFLDYGMASDVFLRFATLIPKTMLDELSKTLFAEGRTQRATGHFLMILVFLGLVYWVGQRMRELTRQMVLFANESLGMQLSLAAEGNSVQQVKEQFAILSQEIVATRRREAEYAAQLSNTNRALESSLNLVKRTHVRLLASEKMAALGGLVAGVAHEINTPVGIGVTAASFLESKTRECQARLTDGKLSRVELEAYFKDAQESSVMILSNLLRAAELVRSFKQVAVDTSSEASRMFDFKTFFGQILHSLQPRLKRTPHKVRLQCPEGLGYFGRPDVFSQIMTNLVLNSLQHGLDEERPGEILIDVVRQGDVVRMRYVDNGRGMTEEDQKRIFEPFFTTARSKGGSGLGMHIVYNLVTVVLAGEIHCSSSPGQGVDFSIIFPWRSERSGQDHQTEGMNHDQ
ncbi:MAG: HAMP domain-containing histidine kinase [Magnetococcus sp. YQC-5]